MEPMTRADLACGKRAIGVLCGWLGAALLAGTSMAAEKAGDSAAAGGRVVLLRNAPTDIVVGKTFDYTLAVANRTDSEVEGVVVESPFPENLRIDGSRPKGQRLADGTVRWNLGRLPSGETRQIQVRATATASGVFTQCERVTYQMVAGSCAVVNPVSPRIQLLKSMPAKGSVCDTIPVALTVRNAGDTVLHGVRVQDVLPAGMKTVDGRQSVVFDAGSFPPGQTREFRFNARAETTGTLVNRAVAVADEGLRVQSESTIEIGQAALAVEVQGPERVFVGRRADYTITVANRGDMPAWGVTVRDTLPAGVEVLEVSRGGRIDESTVTWSLEQMPPNAQVRLTLAVRSSAPLSLHDTVTATGRCAETVTAGTATEFTGISALLLEVIDLDDPIEVGAVETYEIAVTNQGSMAATNVRIACTLEDNMTYVSSSGPTGANIEGATIGFAPLPILEPKARATWQVRVNAVKPGDVRFEVEMIGDQLTRPVRETEATNVY